MTALSLPQPIARHLRTARELVESRRRTPEEEVFTTACRPLDELLDGGLRRGETVELVGGRSSGRFSLVLSTLAAVTAAGEVAALVDLGDSLTPRAAEALGADLERLLWVRPRKMKQALLSAEAILSCGFPLLVVDLGLPPVPGGRGAEAHWLRLARSALARRAALLVSSPYRAAGTAPRTVLRAREIRPQWTGKGSAPRLLTGVDARIERVKQRHAGAVSSPETLHLRQAEALLDTASSEDSTSESLAPVIPLDASRFSQRAS